MFWKKWDLKPFKPFHEMSNPRISDEQQGIFFPEHEVTDNPKTWRDTVEGYCSICGHKVWIQKECEEYALANGIICTCCVYSQIKKEDYKELHDAIKNFGK